MNIYQNKIRRKQYISKIMSNRTKLRLSYCILQETLKFKIKSGNININNDKILAHKNLTYNA